MSNDSTSLPDVYLYNDAMSLGSDVSPIISIDGMDVETWINNLATQQPYDHDPDANYNNVLYNSAWGNGSMGIFASSSYPTANDTVLTFANGSTYHLATWAETDGDWKNVTDGASFFQAFCNNNGTSDSSSTPTTTLAPFASVAPQTKITPTAYPVPYIVTDDLSVAGFLPESSDLAVLKVPGFEASDKVAFQNTVRGLLATAQAQGRKKIIIDFRGNGGGDAILDQDFTRELFPNILPYSANTDRSTTLFQQAAIAASQLQDGSAAVGSEFDYRDKLDMNGKDYPSVQAYIGPFTSYGDNFTAPTRFNLTMAALSGQVQVVGFGNNSLVPQVFQPADVIVLSDGMCGSACADASEVLKSQAHVKTIVVGGRKQNGPMQGIGGTKGGNVWSLKDTMRFLNGTNSTDVSNLSADLWTDGAARLVQRASAVRANFQNNIRINDSSITPLQYIYEAADCRFFYTSKMLTDQSLVWQKAYDIAWKGATCVPGSAEQPSSLSGKLLSYIKADPPVGANYTFNSTSQAWPSGVENKATVVKTITPVPAPSTGSSLYATATTYLGTDAAPTSSGSPSSSSSSTAKSGGSRLCHSGGVVATVLLAYLALAAASA